MKKQVIPETSPEFDSTRLIERPNGFYWQSKDGKEEFGPFATLLEAVQDMQAKDGAAIEPGETKQEAEDEIGIADWVDPETGEPAEGGVPRIEEH
ncbi:MAG TPA: hypothetical protein VMI74_03355 [Burkholderiales bacterium]|nr:hypothetical protein [Burkholderiales bacterium]